MRRELLHRLEKLERLLAAEDAPGGGAGRLKRAVPQWLQASLENRGFVFDYAGQVVSSPDQPARPEPVRPDQLAE